MTDAECDAIALIVNAANACGLEHVAGVLRRNGYRIDELGHVVEKIGECTRCKLNTHVILNKRSGEFLCMLCRIDSALQYGVATRSQCLRGDAGTAGEGAVAAAKLPSQFDKANCKASDARPSAASEPAHSEEVTQ